MGKNLKKAITFSVILVSVLSLLNWMILYGVKSSEKGQTGKINQLFLHKIHQEVVVFGASNGEVGFDAKLFTQLSGKSSFNMCIDGTDISQYADLIKELCEYSKTKEVIFTLPPNGMFEAKLPTEVNRYLAWFDNKYITQNKLYHNYEGFYKLRYVPFYGFTVYNNVLYRTSIDGWAKKLVKYNPKSCYETMGWNSMDVKWGQNNSTLAIKEPIKLHINPKTLEIMEELIVLLKSKNKKATFVIMPAEKSAFKMFTNYTEYKQSIKKLCLKHQMAFIDFNNDSITNDTEYFYNFTHLNKEGADLFTTKLVNKLNSYSKSR